MINVRFLLNEIAFAFTRMLCYSLGIGAVAAFLAMIIVLTTRNAKAAIRYKALIILLSLCVSASVLTFFTSFRSLPESSLKETLSYLTTNAKVDRFPIFSNSVVDVNTDLLASLLRFLDENAVFVFWIWLLTFSVRIAQIGVGLQHVRKVKTCKLHTPGNKWATWVQQRSCQLGITKAIRFVQSDLVRLPVVIGHFKPIVLVPLGLLSELSQHQIESILVHELTHIKRNDYLVNLIQSLIEAVFFFNPAFIWISSLIKQDREKCCDEVAVHNHNSKAYLEALMSFEISRYESSQAMALVPKKHLLAERVKVILTGKNSSLSTIELYGLIIAILLSTYSFMAFKPNEKAQKTALESKKIKGVQTNAIQATGHYGNQIIKPKVSANYPTSQLTVTDRQSVSQGADMLRKISTDTRLPMASRKPSVKKVDVGDTGTIPFQEYNNISIKPLDGANGLRRIEADGVDGLHFKIDACLRNINKMFVNSKEVSKASFGYYDGILQHIETNFHLNQRSLPRDLKKKMLQIAELGANSSLKIDQAFKQSKDTSSLLRFWREMKREEQIKLAELYPY